MDTHKFRHARFAALPKNFGDMICPCKFDHTGGFYKISIFWGGGGGYKSLGRVLAIVEAFWGVSKSFWGKGGCINPWP